MTSAEVFGEEREGVLWVGDGEVREDEGRGERDAADDDAPRFDICVRDYVQCSVISALGI